MAEPPAFLRVGLVGTGNMGRPMAALIAGAGHPLILFDRDAAAAEAVAAAVGAIAAPDGPSLAAASDALILMLPNGAVVREVLLGGSGFPGLAAHLPHGALIVDMGSSDPVGTQALGVILADRGFRFIDAPVSGGVRRAVAGTLTIMAGGAPDLVEAARPLLDILGTVHPTGPLGSGHALKALNNYVSAAGLAAAAEALLIGQRFGLDGAVVTRLLNASTGRNNATENKLAQFILNGDFGSGFALGLMAKDVRIAGALADALAVPSPLLRESARLWTEAEQTLPTGADHTEIYRFLQAGPG